MNWRHFSLSNDFAHKKGRQTGFRNRFGVPPEWFCADFGGKSCCATRAYTSFNYNSKNNTGIKCTIYKIKEIIRRIISYRLYNGTPIDENRSDWRPFRCAKKFRPGRRGVKWSRSQIATDGGLPAGAARPGRAPPLAPGRRRGPQPAYMTICTKFHSSLKP